MRYALVGYGVGNRALCSKLVKMGHEVFVSEIKLLSEDERSQLIGMNVQFEEGKNTEKICQADVVVVSPSVKYDHPIISNCSEKVVTDIDVILNIKKPRVVIAVTGSNGKTTTCNMIFHVLNSTGKSCYMCGNVGEPVANLLDSDPEYVVLEISSFQLYWSKRLPIDIGVLLNIQPNHLDWHPTFQHYIQSKLKIFDFANLKIFNGSDKTIKDSVKVDSTYHAFEPLVVDKSSMQIIYNQNKYHVSNQLLLTRQNLENLSAVLKIFSLLDYEPGDVLKALESFRLPRHRMELVAKIRGVSFIDDSKATSAAATISALENFTEKNVILILSGKSKNEDYAPLVEQMKSKVRHVYVFGELASLIKDILHKEGFPFTVVENMKQAVYSAFEMANEGDVVLLSPAGSSFDMYRNYSERGDDFVRVVKSLMGDEG